jgi:TetR/AcrR family transcriptional repressor of nem operon
LGSRRDAIKSDEGSSDRRAALVAAAFECIARVGFEGLRLRNVAAEVGIDHSTLHHYFRTKEDLVAAVLDQVTRRFWGTMRPDAEPVDRLHGHLTSLARMMREEPALFTVLAELDLRARHDPAVGGVLARDEAGWRGALASLFREGLDRREWTPGLDVDAAVEVVIAVVKGVRLAPERATQVLGQLERLLVSPGGVGSGDGSAGHGHAD